MQKEIDEHNKGKPTPQRQSIATPETTKPHDDYTTITKHTIAIILAGVMQKQPRSPDTNSSSESSDMNCSNIGLYRVANGGGGGDGGRGGLGDDEHRDSNSMGGGNYGHNGKRHEFMLVKASNSTVTTFTGINFTTNPYLQLYKAMRRLIYSQGGDGELLLELLTIIEKT